MGSHVAWQERIKSYQLDLDSLMSHIQSTSNSKDKSSKCECPLWVLYYNGYFLQVEIVIHSPKKVSSRFVKFKLKRNERNLFLWNVYLWRNDLTWRWYTRNGIWPPSNFGKHIFLSEEILFMPSVKIPQTASSCYVVYTFCLCWLYINNVIYSAQI